MIEFDNYLSPGRKGHLVGIGGVSMSSLAEVLKGMGISVVGSDMNENPNVVSLRAHGIHVHVGHDAANITDDIEFVVRTAAVHDDNPEIIRAHELGIPVFERTQAWGAISKGYSNALCISGTHGKTTTTSMCTHILMAADRDPTVMIGGTLPLLNAGHRVGRGNTIIMEACEYYNSFLSFHPTVAVILNIEADHLDFFKDLGDIQHSFRSFAELVPQETGHVVANYDNASARTALNGLDRPLFWFSLHDPKADCRAEHITWADGLPSFDIVIHGEVYAHVELKVGGEHNICNALAAASAAYLLGVDGKAVEEGLAAFTGAGRRFEHKGVYHGAEVYDDYAHHPDEVEALLSAVRPLPHKRLICAFQPHTYTRTAALFDDFVRVLRQPDKVVLAEIYAAREKNELGISSRDLAARIPGAVYCATLEQVADELARLAQPGDMILTVGAGDIYRAGEMLLERGDAE